MSLAEDIRSVLATTLDDRLKIRSIEVLLELSERDEA